MYKYGILADVSCKPEVERIFIVQITVFKIFILINTVSTSTMIGWQYANKETVLQLYMKVVWGDGLRLLSVKI